MPRVADYLILSDGKFMLSTIFKDKVFKFADAGLPSNVHSGSRSVSE